VATGADPQRTSETTVGHFYASAATTEIKSALFARLCVLVEGPTEALAMPELLKLVGFDHLREGIAVVSVEGIGNIAKWYRFFTSLGVPCYCIFDTDSDKTGRQADERLRNRQDIMRAIGEDAGRADQGALTTDAMHVEAKFATLSPNFESAANNLLGAAWVVAYEESASVVGEHSKPLRARYAAQRLRVEDLTAEAADALRDLARTLRQRLGIEEEETAGESLADPWAAPAPTPWDDEEIPF
jgi:putative ATP-dependent endonuclease of the OLD family